MLLWKMPCLIMCFLQFLFLNYFVLRCFIICAWILSERTRHSAQMSLDIDHCRYNGPWLKTTNHSHIRKNTLTYVCEQQGNKDKLEPAIVLSVDLLGVVLSPWWGFLLEERTGVGVGGPDRSTSRRVWKAWWFRLCSVRKRSVGFSNSRF